MSTSSRALAVVLALAAFPSVCVGAAEAQTCPCVKNFARHFSRHRVDRALFEEVASGGMDWRHIRRAERHIRSVARNINPCKGIKNQKFCYAIMSCLAAGGSAWIWDINHGQSVTYSGLDASRQCALAMLGVWIG
jgi:hypothetical protein